jgi:hypothetical protein
MSNFIHSKQHRSAIQKRELNRLLDRYAASIPRVDEAPATFTEKSSPNVEVKFKKRGGTPRPTNDLPADKTAKFNRLLKEYQKAGLSFDYAATKARDEVYGPPGTDALIYGPNWRPAAWGDSQFDGTAAPASDGTQSAGLNVGSRSAADGSPAQPSADYVGKHDNLVTPENIADLLKQFPAELKGDIVRAGTILRNGGR